MKKLKIFIFLLFMGMVINSEAAIVITNPGTGSGTIKLWTNNPPNALLLEECFLSNESTCQVGVTQNTINGNVIEAIASPDSFFVGWSGATGVVSGCNDSTRRCNITGSSAGAGHNVNATFTACTVSINPLGENFNWRAGAGNIAVTTNNASCNWSAISNANWITLSGATNGTGSGYVSYNVSTNFASSARKGTIEINNKLFTVFQDGYMSNILITPEMIDFGIVKTGELSERFATIKNLSDSQILKINNIQITGQDKADYSVAHSCTDINPKGSCIVKIAFNPSSAGSKNAILSIVSNDIHIPNYEVSLTGNSNTTARANIAVSPDSVTFPFIDIEFGNSGSITISNSGTGSLLISELRFSGVNAHEFYVNNSCPIVLPNETCTITFSGNYSSNSPKEAFLLIYSNAQNKPVVEIPIAASSPNCLNGKITLHETAKTINKESASYSVGLTKIGEGGCIWLISQQATWLSTNLTDTTLNYTSQTNNSNTLRMGNISLGKEVYTVIQHKDESNTTFDDIAGNFFKNYINAIYSKGITVGCIKDKSFCPSDNVTRGEMAAFIIRALQGEAFNYKLTPYFSDVPLNHNFFKYVQKFRDLSITQVTGIYRVNDPVTRGEMAAFIIRALFGENFTYKSTPYFTDVPSSHHFFKYIQKMKETGITKIVGQYRVDDAITRGEMAAFLGRAFLSMR